ncbi:hypothetical protein V1478_007077 [Vespula squamosa]|uniref:Uncharacterized protein n=1 Tax=Vespula squamosa TaxID=30214 RepID=A0ABD2B256_VESSQ
MSLGSSTKTTSLRVFYPWLLTYPKPTSSHLFSLMAHKNGSALQGQRRNVPMRLSWDREKHRKENGTFLKLQKAWNYHTLVTAVLYSNAGPKPLALVEILRQNDSSHDSNDK